MNLCLPSFKIRLERCNILDFSKILAYSNLFLMVQRFNGSMVKAQNREP